MVGKFRLGLAFTAPIIIFSRLQTAIDLSDRYKAGIPDYAVFEKFD
jgi:hypothetical protein